MKTNNAGIALIKSFEGFRAKAYRCPAGVWTCGFGTTLNITPTTTCTEAQAEAWLRRDLAVFEGAVTKAVKVPLTDNQFAALVSLTYNIGAGAFTKSTLVRLLNQGHYAEAQAQFARWNKAGGKTLAGLTRRRAAEAKLFGSTTLTAPADAPIAAPKTGFFTALLNLFRKGK